MVEGFRPAVPRERQPLTYMAQEAIAGRSGVNVIGYRDYRGVPVVGAWTWDQTMGMGVVTELDVEEAYEPLTVTREIVLAMLGALGVSMALVTGVLVRRTRALSLSLARQEAGEAALLAWAGDIERAMSVGTDPFRSRVPQWLVLAPARRGPILRAIEKALAARCEALRAKMSTVDEIDRVQVTLELELHRTRLRWIAAHK